MSEVTALEQQRSNCQTLIERRDAVERLSSNPDFKQLILQHFMIDECAVYAHNTVNPNLTAEQRADALSFAQSAGQLKRWLNIVVQMGNAAANEIGEVEHAILEAQQEAGE